ncbi:hypothetical protein BJY27_000822 [Streptomyces rapamycinicus]|uniref:Uncharacterized protein n=1 Tax=Streptomyces rapamycinicus TaxID=1226757 RepID=A0ABR6LC06_9ACTN|nr:hypothetical protein [Streptomyces rapamycinicus]
MLQRTGVDGFGADDDVAPRGQVQVREPVTEPPGRVLEREGRGGGVRGDGEAPQPAGRIADELFGAHEPQIVPHAHGGEQTADEPHVVVERQPGGPGVARAPAQCGPDQREVGLEVGPGDPDPAGPAAGARGELEEGESAGFAGLDLIAVIAPDPRLPAGARGGQNPVGQGGEALGGDGNGGLGLPQDPGRVLHVLGLGGERRRGDEADRGARGPDAEERGQTRETGGKEDTHHIAGAYPSGRQ